MSLHHSPQQLHPAERSSRWLDLSPKDSLSAFGGVALLILLLVFLRIPWHGPQDTHNSLADKILYRHTHIREYMVMFGVLSVIFLLQPALAAILARLQTLWRPLYTFLLLTATCAFIWVFLVHEGRHQFGGFDFGALIDTGWRQILGQRLYTDFVATSPPGFALGIKYAFDIFGVSWNANLYFSAFFASATFLWMYWLMRQVGFGILAAFGSALAVECQGMLLLDFWWYNNSALVLAAIFLLSCLAYALISDSIRVQLSYFFALTLLSLMKPNIAGVTILGGFTLLLVVARHRWRVIALTLAAAAGAVGILIANHISVSAMLYSYHEASKYRGGFNAFGFLQMTRVERTMTVLGLCALSIPGLWLVPRFIQQFRQKETRPAAVSFFFPLALMVSIYASMTNGEFWLVECSPLLVVVAYFSYSLAIPPKLIQRFFTAMVCASIAASLFIGIVRLRVYTIGANEFFEWTNNENLISHGFLKDMRVGLLMTTMENEITFAVKSNPGPYLFGPRIDFNYAVQHLPSPEGLPAWWQPGSSFGMDQEPHLIQVWEDHHFRTLIFLKGDYTFYPSALLDEIRQDYIRDDRFPRITVYHRRSGTPSLTPTSSQTPH